MQAESEEGYRAVFFATSGPDMAPISLAHLLDWVIPFEQNMHQGFCKAYARLDLSLSRTTPVIVFMPSQVRHIEDARADGKPESGSFNDLALLFHSSDSLLTRQVMNDGCSRISVGAAKEVCRKIGRTGNRPSTFQGRVNGCKGMWTISAHMTRRIMSIRLSG